MPAARNRWLRPESAAGLERRLYSRNASRRHRFCCGIVNDSHARRVGRRPALDRARRLEGRITNIDPTDPRYVTVRVEMHNKDVGLVEHTNATVIVPAEQK